jgi:carboxymethylenebutenolidase
MLHRMIERRVDIDTPDGTMPTFVVHPEEGGPYPVVLYLMDAPGIRPALRDMASRLASVGYYVLLPYLYYRGGPYREFTASDEDMHARRELMATVTPEGMVSDAPALLDVAAQDPAASDGPIGVVGFCMSGRSVVALAQAYPERVAAGASIHGAWLVSDADGSVHRHVDRIRAELYFGWADDDATAPREDLAVMDKALTDAGVRHRIDFMEGAFHGFAPPDHAHYDRDTSERHWERVLDLFRRNL